MAEKMTRAQAVEFAIEVIRNYEGDCEATEILGKMHEQLTKPRAKSNVPTKTQRENTAKAEEVLELLKEQTQPVTGAWISDHVSGLLTPQKTTAIMNILVKNGSVIKDRSGKRVTYQVA